MKIDAIMSDDALLAELGQALAARRIALNLTQAELADQAGIGKRTVERVEAGHSCQTAALIRILRVLELLTGLARLIPPAGPGPMDLLKRKGRARRRASSKRRPAGAAPESGRAEAPGAASAKKKWNWGDEE